MFLRQPALSWIAPGHWDTSPGRVLRDTRRRLLRERCPYADGVPAKGSGSGTTAAGSVGVTDHVDDDAVRVADEEAPRTPRLLVQRVDDLVAAPASLGVGHIDVVDVHADRRVLGRGRVPRHEG